jgi:type IV secretion system protein VirB9
MTKTLRIAALLACSFFTPAFAQADDDMNLPIDARVKLLMYDEADIYTITTRYGYQTNLVFSGSEEVQTISVGDRSLWQIIPSGNRLFIRPMADDVTTNMTILTNKHSYQFDLKSLPADVSKGNIYVAKFVYPEDRPQLPPPPPAPPPAPPVALMPAMPPPPPPVVTLAPLQANYHYTYQGPDALAPRQVYDDGNSTYFQWPSDAQPLPKIYVVHPGGSETLVTPYLKDGKMVVDTIAAKFALKSPGGTVYVYNELLAAK